jgi:hypothetical protein
MGLKIIASRSPWMALPPYKICMKIYHGVQKLLVGDTQTDWWFDELDFLFWKYAKNIAIIYAYANLCWPLSYSDTRQKTGIFLAVHCRTGL